MIQLFVVFCCAWQIIDVQASNSSGWSKGFLDKHSGTPIIKQAKIAPVVHDAIACNEEAYPGAEEVFPLITTAYPIELSDLGIRITELGQELAEFKVNLINVCMLHDLNLNKAQATIKDMKKEYNEQDKQLKKIRDENDRLQIALQNMQRKCHTIDHNVDQQGKLRASLEVKIQSQRATIAKHDEEVDLHIKIARDHKFARDIAEKRYELLHRTFVASMLVVGAVGIVAGNLYSRAYTEKS